MSLDLSKLHDFFSEKDIEWKPQTVTKDGSKGLAVAYITNRAIMQRLDDVCGPENWANRFEAGPDGGIMCGIGIRREDGEWVWKYDGADATDIERVKGGMSAAMKRAAVQWGIGRYLYDMPTQWVPMNEYKRFAQEPKVPAAFLPKASRRPASPPTGAPAPPADEAPVPSANGALVDADPLIREINAAGELSFGAEWTKARGAVAAHISKGRTRSMHALTNEEAAKALVSIQRRIERGRTRSMHALTNEEAAKEALVSIQRRIERERSQEHRSGEPQHISDLL